MASCHDWPGRLASRTEGDFIVTLAHRMQGARFMMPLFFVFMAGFVYVTLETVRIRAVARGSRHLAAVVAAVLISLFWLVADSVLDGPLSVSKVVAYGAGYWLGTYFGLAITPRLERRSPPNTHPVHLAVEPVAQSQGVTGVVPVGALDAQVDLDLAPPRDAFH